MGRGRCPRRLLPHGGRRCRGVRALPPRGCARAPARGGRDQAVLGGLRAWHGLAEGGQPRPRCDSRAGRVRCVRDRGAPFRRSPGTAEASRLQTSGSSRPGRRSARTTRWPRSAGTPTSSTRPSACQAPTSSRSSSTATWTRPGTRITPCTSCRTWPMAARSWSCSGGATSSLLTGPAAGRTPRSPGPWHACWGIVGFESRRRMGR